MDAVAALNQLFQLCAKRWHLFSCAHITLIPKADDIVRIKAFRPISLMHSFAKILSKLLSLKLAP